MVRTPDEVGGTSQRSAEELDHGNQEMIGGNELNI